MKTLHNILPGLFLLLDLSAAFYTDHWILVNTLKTGFDHIYLTGLYMLG